MDITTGWVSRRPQSRGLGDLAVQAPCVSIYSQLLRGITNVTDRTRYYSLYPWLIWSFDRRAYPKGDAAKFETIFRRADCVLTPIAERHVRVLEEDDKEHRAAMVGRNTLASVVAGLGKGSDKLSRFPTRDDVPDAILQESFRRLGTVLRGVLHDLGIVAPREGESFKYTRERGRSHRQRGRWEVNGDAFFASLENDRPTVADLNGLGEFCPRGLKHSRAEYQICRPDASLGSRHGRKVSPYRIATRSELRDFSPR